MIRGLIDRLMGRTPPLSIKGPVDPSGARATGKSQHLIVERDCPGFRLVSSRTEGELRWWCGDTSVVRLDPADDTLSTMVLVVGPGTATVRVSDGVCFDSYQVTVKPRELSKAPPLGISVEQI